jgi:hypothetical protein
MPVLTVDVTELAGIPWGSGGSHLRGYVHSNADASLGDDTIYLGQPPLTFSGTVATLTLPATTGEQYEVVLEWSDGGKRVTWRSGWFSLTADANLRDLATSPTPSQTPLGVYSGTGSPEGVVTAGIGAEYVAMDTTGAYVGTVWRKRTASGNTGWVVVEGDTGWRSVTSASANITGTFLLARHVRDVKLEANFTATVTAAPASPETIYTLPVGLRPKATVYTAHTSGSSGASKPLVITTTGEVRLYSLVNGDQVHFNVPIRTDEPWPTALPGTAA